MTACRSKGNSGHLMNIYIYIYMGGSSVTSPSPPVQIMPQDPSKDVKIRDHKQRPGEEGLQVRQSHHGLLLHASRNDHLITCHRHLQCTALAAHHRPAPALHNNKGQWKDRLRQTK
uniref:Putative methyladenine glycosylase family protein n=1 Tax=Davidia involucrata TaxID=16924 RepID=A0A5B7BIQ8_DAVIN